MGVRAHHLTLRRDFGSALKQRPGGVEVAGAGGVVEGRPLPLREGKRRDGRAGQCGGFSKVRVECTTSASSYACACVRAAGPRTLSLQSLFAP